MRHPEVTGILVQVEFELSAQDHASVPSGEFTIVLMALYVPAIKRNIPARITNMLQATPINHRGDAFASGLFQLSYSHIQPIGWNDISGPKRAPMRATSCSKIGIPLAMQYDMTVIVRVEPSQVTQWIRLLAVRCSEPRKKRINMNLAESLGYVSYLLRKGRLEFLT